MTSNVIVLEFNELTPHLIDRFIKAGMLPNFKKLREQSIAAITDAGEQHPQLEPWIQWVTVHTGMPYSEHKVFDLDDGVELKAPRIWDIVSAAGRKVWICGSMNAAVQGSSINGHVIPDPWASRVPALPAGYFEPYLDLVRTYVQEYTAAKTTVSPSVILRFGRFMLANGLSLTTIRKTIAQLADERRSPSKWRRAAILDRLQWDMFRKIYQKERPALATFFLNSTAHYQHYFWRNMDPQPFANKPDAEQQAKYGDAVEFGYRQMDQIVGEAFALADENTSIVLCTALSQQPMLTHEDRGGKQIFKPHDQERLFRFAGVAGQYEYAPVMAEQFHLIFADEQAAADAEQKIQALRLDDGTELMLARREGNRIFSGCKLEQFPASSARIVSQHSNESVLFTEFFYPVEAVRSGMHHPDGILWVRLPSRERQVINRKVPLIEVAPTLLSLVGIDPCESLGKRAMPEIEHALLPMALAG